MKTIFSIAGLFLLMLSTSCKKEETEKKAEEQITKHSPPAWKVEAPGRFPATMIAVVALPADLQAAAANDDQLAAFINGECRGEGTAEKIGNHQVYFFLIRGLDSEQSKIVFKYYSAKTAYMYQTEPEVSFKIDDVYGTAENPKVLTLKLVK